MSEDMVARDGTRRSDTANKTGRMSKRRSGQQISAEEWEGWWVELAIKHLHLPGSLCPSTPTFSTITKRLGRDEGRGKNPRQRSKKTKGKRQKTKEKTREKKTRGRDTRR
jgi:hypothetical protein